MKILKSIRLFVLLLIFWIVLNESLEIKVILSGMFYISFVVVLMNIIVFRDDEFIIPSARKFIWFTFIITVEIFKSAIIHVIRIIINETNYEVFDVDFENDDVVIISLIANAITLTPGTIALDIKGNVIKVLGFVKDKSQIEKNIASIKKYEKPFL